LALTLRALDARVEGNSYRTIAEGLFGAKRITERAWKTHDLRNRTIRLVQSGFALTRGGYRALLAKRAASNSDHHKTGVPKTDPPNIGIPLRRSTPPS
jgi:hypothetical protein